MPAAMTKDIAEGVSRRAFGRRHPGLGGGAADPFAIYADAEPPGCIEPGADSSARPEDNSHDDGLAALFGSN